MYFYLTRVCGAGVLLWLMACSSPAAETSTPTAPSADPVLAHSLPDTVGPTRTVRQYLRWCATHYDKLPADFLTNDDTQDTTKAYALHGPGTEAWLAAVQQSGLVSDAYITGWRRYFRQYGDTLRLHPQYEGVAPGFAYDFLTLSQDPETQLAELLPGTMTVTPRSSSQVVVRARGPRHDGWQAGLDFQLTAGPQGRWLIDTIRVAESTDL